MLRSFLPAVVFSLSVALSGCHRGPKIEVNGIVIYERYWTAAVAEVQPRASFELDCPPESLEFTLFRRSGPVPTDVGVRGCGRRSVYVNTGIGWFAGPPLVDGEQCDLVWQPDESANESAGESAAAPAETAPPTPEAAPVAEPAEPTANAADAPSSTESSAGLGDPSSAESSP